MFPRGRELRKRLLVLAHRKIIVREPPPHGPVKLHGQEHRKTIVGQRLALEHLKTVRHNRKTTVGQRLALEHLKTVRRNRKTTVQDGRRRVRLRRTDRSRLRSSRVSIRVLDRRAIDRRAIDRKALAPRLHVRQSLRRPGRNNRPVLRRHGSSPLHVRTRTVRKRHRDQGTGVNLLLVQKRGRRNRHHSAKRVLGNSGTKSRTRLQMRRERTKIKTRTKNRQNIAEQTNYPFGQFD